MHPGPMNRGIEIAADVAEGPASIIVEQVTQRRRRAHGRAVHAPRRRRRCGIRIGIGGDLSRELVIKGGRVVDAAGERAADVLVRGGHVVERR